MQSGGCEMLGIVQLCGSQIRCHGVASALELLRHLDSLSERGSHLPVLMRGRQDPVSSQPAPVSELGSALGRMDGLGSPYRRVPPLSGLALPHRSHSPVGISQDVGLSD